MGGRRYRRLTSTQGARTVDVGLVGEPYFGCPLVDCLDFNFLGFYDLYHIWAREAEDSPITPLCLGWSRVLDGLSSSSMSPLTLLCGDLKYGPLHGMLVTVVWCRRAGV